jgi:molecular chaperone HtpG
VVDEHDISANLKRLLKAAGQTYPESRPILEINAEHALVKRLKDETNDKRVEDWSALLLDQAILSEGGQLDDPAAFVRRLNDVLLVAALAR